VKLHPVKIRIKNFQSIDDLEIEVNGFTCITGPSNIGKSAIIRATSSAILNNPVVNMVRKGTQFTTVELASEEWAFKWEKNDKGVNRVFIPPSAEKALDKIGQTQVPEIVKMGFGSIEIGDDEIQPWFAPQFEPLFLLNQSGPRVTDFLSEVSRLMTLQDAIVLAARGKRAQTDKAKTKAEEAAGLKTKLAKVGALDTLERLGSDLEEQARSIEQYEDRIQLGEALIAKRQDAERIIALFSQIEELRIPRDHCGEPVKKVQELYHLCYQLEAAAVKIRAVHPVTKVKIPDPPAEQVDKLRELRKFAKIEPLRQSVKLLEDVSKIKTPDLKKVKTDVEKLQKMAGFATQIQSLQASVALLDRQIPIPAALEEVENLQRLSEFARQTKALAAEIADLETSLVETSRELTQVEAEIAAIPSCPTCNRPIGGQHTGKHQRLSA
jgi:DNA repair ATPase RecN